MRKLTVRLRRIGWNKRFVYAVVIMFRDKRPRGRLIEKIGFYAPGFKIKIFFINFARLAFWLAKGVIVTTKVGFLLGKLSLLEVKNINL